MRLCLNICACSILRTTAERHWMCSHHGLSLLVSMGGDSGAQHLDSNCSEDHFVRL